MDEANERRAFELLQWVPHSLPSEFDPALAAKNHYTQLQRKRSDLALDAWEQAHAFESSTEMKSFKKLHVLTNHQHDAFFSPARARSGFYSARLRDLTVSECPQNTQAPRRRYRFKRTGIRLASFDEERGSAS